MIDYHSHILPQMDDGSQSMEESLEMLHQSFCQGVDVMVSTCHFYADEEDPKHFVDRRNQAFFRLRDAMATRAESLGRKSCISPALPRQRTLVCSLSASVAPFWWSLP